MKFRCARWVLLFWVSCCSFSALAHNPEVTVDDLVAQGIPEAAAQNALDAYHELLEHRGTFDDDKYDGNHNLKYFTIVDFTMPIYQPRMHIIQAEKNDNGSVQIESHYVDHGINSAGGPDLAWVTQVSNSLPAVAGKPQAEGSFQSAAGLFVTGSAEDSGKTHLHLLLRGRDSDNRSAADRGIYVHGVTHLIPENSEGCFIVDSDELTGILHKIKSGSVFYVYWDSAVLSYNMANAAPESSLSMADRRFLREYRTNRQDFAEEAAAVAAREGTAVPPKKKKKQHLLVSENDSGTREI